MTIGYKNLCHGCIFHLAISYGAKIALIARNDDLYHLTPNHRESFDMLVLHRTMYIDQPPKEFQGRESYVVQFNQKQLEWIKESEGDKAIAVLLIISGKNPEDESTYSLFFISPDKFADFKEKFLTKGTSSFTITREQGSSFRATFDDKFVLSLNSFETYLKNN